MTRRLRADDGQSSIELLATIPLLTVVVLAAAQLLTAGATRISASSAAEAAAMALLQGGSPTTAAHAATPGWAHPRITVRTTGRHVRVRLRPPGLLPGLSGLLTATAEADAGPGAEARATSPTAAEAIRTAAMNRPASLARRAS